MGKLRKLQEQYLKGEITKAVYNAEVKKLLDDEILDQEQYDTALEYDPEEEKPQFTQADVDRMVVAKAVKMVRKALKDAGVEGLEGVGNKELLAKVAELAKGKDDGEGNKGKSDDAETLKWKTAAEKAGATIKDLTIENAVLKGAGKYNPINATQVVRALKLDYMDLVEIDDEGKVDSKTVDRALRKIYDAEPNLFNKEDGDGAGDNTDPNKGGTGFKGKGPGGGTGGGGKGDDLDKKAAEALTLMGFKKPAETK